MNRPSCDQYGFLEQEVCGIQTYWITELTVSLYDTLNEHLQSNFDYLINIGNRKLTNS